MHMNRILNNPHLGWQLPRACELYVWKSIDLSQIHLLQWVKSRQMKVYGGRGLRNTQSERLVSYLPPAWSSFLLNCVNSPNSFFWSSTAMPAPVSVTSTRNIPTAPAPTCTRKTHKSLKYSSLLETTNTFTREASFRLLPSPKSSHPILMTTVPSTGVNLNCVWAHSTIVKLLVAWYEE